MNKTIGKPRAITHVSTEAKQFKKTVQILCLQARVRMIEGDLAVSLKVYRPKRIGDLDNTIKVLLDSLKGFAFEDDKQIIRIVADRYDDKMKPRVEVEIVKMETPGEQIDIWLTSNHPTPTNYRSGDNVQQSTRPLKTLQRCRNKVTTSLPDNDHISTRCTRRCGKGTEWRV